MNFNGNNLEISLGKFQVPGFQVAASVEGWQPIPGLPATLVLGSEVRCEPGLVRASRTGSQAQARGQPPQPCLCLSPESGPLQAVTVQGTACLTRAAMVTPVLAVLTPASTVRGPGQATELPFPPREPRGEEVPS